MYHKIENWKKLSIDEICDYFLIWIETIYKKYDFLGITKEDIIKTLKEEIVKTKDLANDTKKYANYIQKEVECKIVGTGIKLFNDTEHATYLIGRYINERFEMPTDYNMAHKQLHKLCYMFEKFQYIPDPATISTLLDNNTILDKMLYYIYLIKTTDKTNGFAETLDDSENTNIVLGIYCMCHGIEMPESEEDEDDLIEKIEESIQDEEEIVEADDEEEEEDEDDLEEEKDAEHDDDDISSVLKRDPLKYYYLEAKNIPRLTEEEIILLCEKIQNGDTEARNKFVEANLRLAMKMAYRYNYLHNETNKISFQDLVQAGNIGLIKAVEKFDVTRGYKFSTYATWWMRVEIVREIQNNCRTMRIPIHMQEKLNSYRSKKNKLLIKMNGTLTLNEIAKQLGLTLSTVVNYEKLLEEEASLNTFISEDETELIEMIDSGVDDYEEIQNESVSNNIRELLDICKLTEYEKNVIIMHYGLFGNEPMTLEDIGDHYGVTKENIRRINAGALAKFRENDKTKELAVYMDNPKRAIKKIEEYRKVYKENRFSRYKSNPLGE